MFYLKLYIDGGEHRKGDRDRGEEVLLDQVTLMSESRLETKAVSGLRVL